MRRSHDTQRLCLMFDFETIVRCKNSKAEVHRRDVREAFLLFTGHSLVTKPVKCSIRVSDFMRHDACHVICISRSLLIECERTCLAVNAEESTRDSAAVVRASRVLFRFLRESQKRWLEISQICVLHETADDPIQASGRKVPSIREKRRRRFNDRSGHKLVVTLLLDEQRQTIKQPLLLFRSRKVFHRVNDRWWR